MASETPGRYRVKFPSTLMAYLCDEVDWVIGLPDSTDPTELAFLAAWRAGRKVAGGRVIDVDFPVLALIYTEAAFAASTPNCDGQSYYNGVRRSGAALKKRIEALPGIAVTDDPILPRLRVA